MSTKGNAVLYFNSKHGWTLVDVAVNSEVHITTFSLAHIPDTG